MFDRIICVLGLGLRLGDTLCCLSYSSCISLACISGHISDRENGVQLVHCSLISGITHFFFSALYFAHTATAITDILFRLQGATGPIGSPGAPGNVGTKGTSGRPGSEGEPGYGGESGEQGPRGPPGSSGEVGEQGESGDVGSKGATVREQGIEHPRTNSFN